MSFWSTVGKIGQAVAGTVEKALLSNMQDQIFKSVQQKTIDNTVKQSPELEHTRPRTVTRDFYEDWAGNEWIGNQSVPEYFNRVNNAIEKGAIKPGLSPSDMGTAFYL